MDLHNQHQERLDATLHAGPPEGRHLIVLGHGVTGNKDRPFAQAIADRAASRGIAALRFSFSGNGASEGRFEDSCISKEVADLGCVLDALPGHRIAYVGHSMGGAVGVLRAARDPRIGFLVSVAGMVHTKEFCERKFGALTPDRDVMWEKPECPLSQTFVDDMRTIDSVVEQASKIEVPWLLVHGSEDTVVPLQDSRDALARAGANAELTVLEGADHVFTPPALEPMAQRVVDWIAERFAGDAAR